MASHFQGPPKVPHFFFRLASGRRLHLAPVAATISESMINLLSISALGFFLGMRHATDPDHVIAVTTIVSRRGSVAKAALTGIFWGIGHTLTIVIVGTIIIFFDVIIPARVGLSMEFSVGLMLVALGAMNIVAFMRSSRSIS